MPPERRFSEADVLRTAADLFTVHGYQGTSLAMLEAATGLGKQSLYNSFGDKRALYLQSLDCAAAAFSQVQLHMQSARDGRAAIALFFDGLVDWCASGDPARSACAVSGGLMEAIDDAVVRRHLQSKWESTREMLRATVERGQKDGSVAATLPSATLADVLMNLMSGLRVSARADLDSQRLGEIARLGLAVLDEPPVV